MQLDFATQVALRADQQLNPGPSGEDTEVSANLAMSDHQFRAKAHGSATSGPRGFFISLIWLIRAPSARTWRISEEEHHARPLHSP
jgi:hypothetical protein